MLSRRGFRLAAVIAACVCVLAIAAGAFAFSYSGCATWRSRQDVSPRLARFYPLIFDAVLIVACAAAVTLRGALRGFAWLAVLVVIGAVATADTVHAMSITVPTAAAGGNDRHRPVGGAADRPDPAGRDVPPRRAAPQGGGHCPGPGERPGAARLDRRTAPAARPDGAAVVPLSTRCCMTRPRYPLRGPEPPRASPRPRGLGQPDAPASPAKTTTGPHAVDPGQRAVAGSPPVVAQAIPAPQAPEPRRPR